ncbi:MAG: hypothetical protein K1X53_13170 [Candidatus Sumerlaeaceae bacterium]|nr:hypothetical protein [Candidatus Sumerlaeaceae bacterium]
MARWWNGLGLCVGLFAGAILVLGGTSTGFAHAITVDGSASDWTGSAPSQIHDASYSNGEWIYKGESGDSRTDPVDPSDSNFDLTEVRLTADATNLYVLVRFADVLATDQVYVGLGIDRDQSTTDTSMNFQGDDSGLTYGNVAAKLPEFIVDIHNATPGVTTVEMYADNGSSWYAPPTHSEFISTTNDLLEAAIPLSSLGLTSSSTFGFSLATFDNGKTSDPSGTAYNNDDDTTVDYPGNDALDCIGGTVGTSQSSWDRDLSDNNLGNQFTVSIATMVPVALSSFLVD